MNYIAIISVLVIIILLLIYISASNKGWNCTENGCEYVSGGFFNSYNKCNSHCKSNSKSSSCIVLRPQLPYYHPSLYYQDNHLERKKKHTDSNKNRNENNIIINNSFPTTASK